MQSACSELERQFSRASEDLEGLTAVLHDDFSRGDSYSKNPVDLLQRLSALAEDLPKVREEWRRVMMAKQDLIDTARMQQLPARRVLKGICTIHNVRLSDQDAGDEVGFAAFKSMASEWDAGHATKLSSLRSAQLLTPEELTMEVLQSAGAFKDKASTPSVSIVEEEIAEPPAIEEVVQEEEDEAEPERPRHHLTEQEFEGVSQVVRGRCTLEECNVLMDLLVSHAAKPKVQWPMTTGAIVKIGGRVVGQTGNCRLSTLRATKRITMSKDGIAPNPSFSKKR
mmetsp:Transcript_11531/g.27934  ORF Transcript_11531/g.27934 Transcript_11531/m.27934 type:complete len:282 (+) Transcript_11531:35-880(+)